VTGVTSARIALFDGGGWGSGITLEGIKQDLTVDHDAMINQVGPQFFRTLGIPLLTGREFTAADREGTPGVAVVNEAFVKKFKLGNDVIGRRAALWDGKDLNLQIVGVVGNAKYGSVKDEAPRYAHYLPELPRLVHQALARVAAKPGIITIGKSVVQRRHGWRQCRKCREPILRPS